MRSRLTPIVIAAVIGAPALTSAQSGSSGQQSADPRVKSRVVIEQQRNRDRGRQDQGHEESETINRTARIGGNGEVIITNLAGDITLVRGSGNEVQVEARKVARGRDAADAREVLGLVTVDFVERGSRLEIRTQFPNSRDLPSQHRRNFNVSVDYAITVPVNTRVSARTVSGDIKADGVRGELSFESTSGDVVISNAERITLAKTTSGDVQVTNSTSELPFEAHTISGDVTIRQVKAPRVELGAISGNVSIGDADIPRIEATTINGDISFTSPFKQGGRYELSTHNGTIRITVAGNNGFEVEANTFSGSIKADPSLNLKKEENPNSRRRERVLRAVYGDGSALLDITTFSGDVVISKK